LTLSAKAEFRRARHPRLLRNLRFLGSIIPKNSISVYAYHILDWQFVAAYFNQMDDDDIREVYDLIIFITSNK